MGCSSTKVAPLPQKTPTDTPKAWAQDLETLSQRIFLAGLDGSGKTTIKHFLQQTKAACLPSRSEPDVVRLTWNSYCLEITDCSGHPSGRAQWPSLLPSASVLVFVVDGSDHLRSFLAVQELKSLLSLSAQTNPPVAVLINKHDFAHSLPSSSLQTLFSPTELLRMHFFEISALTGSGMPEAMQWIVNPPKPTVATTTPAGSTPQHARHHPHHHSQWSHSFSNSLSASQPPPAAAAPTTEGGILHSLFTPMPVVDPAAAGPRAWFAPAQSVS